MPQKGKMAERIVNLLDAEKREQQIKGQQKVAFTK